MMRASRISTRARNALFKCFVLDMSATQAAAMSKVSRPCANRYYREYREKIYRALRKAPRFSGEVEIDQAFFGGRGGHDARAQLKALSELPLPRREYERRAKLIRKNMKIQVFGIRQRFGDVYVQIIPKADKNTLMPIIRLVVEEGSTIYTDQWRGFADLKIDGYTHKSINHSLEYSDKKGTHINSIEAFWSYAKRRMAKFNGISRTTWQLHLKECEFRYNHKDDLATALKALL